MPDCLSSDTAPERGVLYIASREPYLSEAVASARSIRDHHPDLPITLDAPEEYDAPPVFDAVRPLEDPSHDFSDSNLTSSEIPYEQTLFLDSDTYVTGSLTPLFDLLDEHDLAASQDPTRTGTAGHSHSHDVPETFPQHNTGVLAYRDCSAVRALFDRWSDLYHALDGDGVEYGLNQPSFRIALYESDVELATLPPEWNFRLGNVANSVLYASGPVRILHGRSMHWDLSEMAARVNETEERRVVIAKPDPEIVTNDDRSATETARYAADRIHWKYRKNGAMSTLLAVGGLARDKVIP